MTNLETNILRALTAYKVEQGVVSDQASAWALANLHQALTKWKGARGPTRPTDRELDGDAYNALKVWAQSEEIPAPVPEETPTPAPVPEEAPVPAPEETPAPAPVPEETPHG